MRHIHYHNTTNDASVWFQTIELDNSLFWNSIRCAVIKPALVSMYTSSVPFASSRPSLGFGSNDTINCYFNGEFFIYIAKWFGYYFSLIIMNIILICNIYNINLIIIYLLLNNFNIFGHICPHTFVPILQYYLTIATPPP